ncbi:hypothetical protein ACFQH6_19005 [Halobacteriaceae archaeon GCM10025711]
MHIITTTCPECGTIVAGNILEERRVLKCPRVGCEAVLRFEDLPEADQSHLLENRERYQI